MEDKEAERMTTVPSAGGIGGKTKSHPQKVVHDECHYNVNQGDRFPKSHNHKSNRPCEK